MERATAARTAGRAWRSTSAAASSTCRPDRRRPISTAPTGSGDNLFANSLLALDAATGKRVWHFQTVRHDIWDRDLPSPPSLVTVRRDGKTIDAVAQTTKHGFRLRLRSRERHSRSSRSSTASIRASDVPGEVAADTQPLPTRPAPFARQRPDAKTCSRRARPRPTRGRSTSSRTFRSDGQFVPLAVGKADGVFPGFDGGAEWGGQAFDPDTGLLLRQRQRPRVDRQPGAERRAGSGRRDYQQNCAACHRDDLQGAPPQIPSLVGIGSRRTHVADIAAIVRQGAGRMPGIPEPDRRGASPRSSNYLRDRRDTASRRGVGRRRATPLVTYRFTGYRQVPRSRRLPGGRAAVGHAERHQPEHRRIRLADSARRVSRARGQGPDEHGQRELRRPDRHGRRTGLHRRHELRPQVPRVRQGHGRAALGGDAALLRQRHAGDLRGRRPAVRRRRRRGRQGRRPKRSGQCGWRCLRCVYAGSVNRPPVGSI